MSHHLDKSTLNALVNAIPLRRYLSRHASTTDEQAELYQETVARVLEQARHSTINNPLGYAIRTARHLITKQRKQSTQDIEDIACIKSNPEALLENKQRISLIYEALAAMPEQRRKVFEMRRIQGESRLAISQQLGISAETVTKHIARAMADIQQHLDRTERTQA